MKNKKFFELKEDVLYLIGEWNISNISEIEKDINRLDKSKISKIDISNLKTLDTFGALLIYKYFKDIPIEPDKEKFINLINMVSSKDINLPQKQKENFFLESVDKIFLVIKDIIYFFNFAGKLTVEVLLKIKDFEINTFLKDIELSGIRALPILFTLSFLIGVVIAYQSAKQLMAYGANIFIADLIFISITRELAPLIVGIILAGRSASSYTAQIGLMNVTEEIDVIRAMGISPYVLLVLPKILSLMLITPLLIVFSDVIGIIGGMVIADSILDITPYQFINRIQEGYYIDHFFAGIIKGPFFGIAIALIGTGEGFKVEKKAESIGSYVTKSVVKSIFAIIFLDTLFSVVFRWLDI